MGGGLRVAVAGATGAVGQQMLRCLERCGLPVAELRPLASAKSAGRSVVFLGRQVPVQVLGPGSFLGIDLALFSCGAAASREFAPVAVAAGALVIDNSSAWRMDPDVPLVVPEVNAQALDPFVADKPGGAVRPGIVANPNCSTIQLVLVLQPLHDAAGLARVVVSTYQSASGAGQKAVDEMYGQVAASPAMGGAGFDTGPRGIHPTTLAFNAIPHIDVFMAGGATREEWKMTVESRKILGLPDLRLHATCVRVPVERGHSEAVHVELLRPLSADEARGILAAAPGVEVLDDPGGTPPRYPTPLQTAGTDATWVGRIRSDDSVRPRGHGLALWVVSDNLLKGAALNAVQIAEALYR